MLSIIVLYMIICNALIINAAAEQGEQASQDNDVKTADVKPK
jgi:hypothetical protein